MFGREAAVKHTLLESENPKYLGKNDGMINVGLMTKLYNIVAHNLNEARKARDGKRKGTMPKEPERLKIGDNILVRDHTSKAFQPKYKDFCVVGLLGKNQVEIKDNHSHITKVHRRDVKKIVVSLEKFKLDILSQKVSRFILSQKVVFFRPPQHFKLYLLIMFPHTGTQLYLLTMSFHPQPTNKETFWGRADSN